MCKLWVLATTRFASTGWLLCACHYQKLLWDKSRNPPPFLSVRCYPRADIHGLQRSAIERHHGSQRYFAEVSLGNSEHNANWGWNKNCSQTYGNVVRSKNVG